MKVSPKAERGDVLCIYHSKDLDGLTCAAIVKHIHPNCTLFGYDYKEDIAPIFDLLDSQKFRLCIIADVSFPVADMLKLLEHMEDGAVQWFDHHKTALAELLNTLNLDFDAKKVKSLTLIEGSGTMTLYGDEPPHYIQTATGRFSVYYRDGMAACEILHKYFVSSHIDSLPVSLAGAYDTWRQAKQIFFLDTAAVEAEWDDILAFQYGMRLPQYYSIAFIEEVLLASDSDTQIALIEKIQGYGHAILAYNEGRFSAVAKSAYTRTINIEGESIRCLCINTGETAALGHLYDAEQHDIAVYYYYDGKGQWKYSIRNISDCFDCGAIAKHYGGGGHRGAAGWSSEYLLVW